jgi:hypothetical protein
LYQLKLTDIIYEHQKNCQRLLPGTQSEAMDQLNVALDALGSDNFLFSLAEPVESAYIQLVEELLGPELWDWVMWWIYETECGTKAMGFQVNHVEYCPTQLTFDQFWTIISA